MVADAAARVERDALGAGELHRQAGPGPEGADVVGRAVAVVAAQPVAADAAVDEAGVPLDRRLGLEAEAVERVGAQVGEEDVRRRQELLEGGAGVVVAQVEDDAAFAAIVLREGRVGEVLAADAERPEGPAHGVTRRRLDLDDVGAPVGQEGAGRRRGDPDPHLDDAQAGEGGEALRL